MDVRSVFYHSGTKLEVSLLYVPTPLPAVPFPAFCLAAARSHSAAAAFEKNALSFSFAGRCRGVAVAEFQMPPKREANPLLRTVPARGLAGQRIMPIAKQLFPVDS
jgi:hypothetical protein